MPVPSEPRPAVETSAAPSARGDVDETLAAAPATDASTVCGFDPPAVGGEVGTLGPYRVVKELGRGGMGAVYAAIDTRLDRPIALKVMLPGFATDADAKGRFLREARAAARIKHDNVVTVYEADERLGVPYIAMEFLKGYPLDGYLKKKGNPAVPQVLRIAAEVAAGLAAAHKIGLVHRDIKPANLWLEAPHGRVKVLDFGLAKPVDAEAELTQSGVIVGTPAYMSPEQARGEKVDHRTDLFSLGGVLYRLCTGKLPFHGPSTMAVLMALGTQEPPPVRAVNPDVPEALAALIHQLLAKRADARPQSAAEVVQRVRAIAADLAPPRPRPIDQSASQPHAVYVPMAVTATFEASPFADLDTEPASLAPVAGPKTAAPVRKKPGGRWRWAAAGFAALAALVLGSVVVVIKNKDGTETKIEVPDGATVTVKGQDGKTIAQVGPEKKPPPVPDPSGDRKAAEWVIAQGGGVRVDGANKDIKAVADLPRDRFTVTQANLDRTAVTDAGLVYVKGLKGLKSLNLDGTAVTDAGLEHLKGLTGLNLSGTAVSDAGLVQLKNLKGLTALWLNGTAVSDAGLEHLKELKGLTRLGLSDTGVSDAGLERLKDHKGLTWLELGGTKVTYAGVAHLKDLKKLTHLWLGGTTVTDAGLEHLKELKGLKSLYLCKTGVTAKGLEAFAAALPACKVEHDGGVIGPTAAADLDRAAAAWVIAQGGGVRVDGVDSDINAVADLPKGGFTVTHANLSTTAFSDAGLIQLKGLKGLTHLNLYRTKVTDAGLSHLKDLKGLKGLGLDNTAVSDAGLERLKELKGLTGLYLAGTKVTDAGLAYLKGLASLSLNGTAVTDAGLVHLKELKDLTMLYLGSTKVSDAGLVHLKELKNLTSLDLRETKVTVKGLEAFHAAVPACKIEHDGGVIEPKK